MVYFENAYIRRYERNDTKKNRIIKSVEVRGLKNTSKFKDQEQIIILPKDELNQLEQLQETNNKLIATKEDQEQQLKEMQEQINKLVAINKDQAKEINQLKEINLNLSSSINDQDQTSHINNNVLNAKLLELMEVVNNRNELLLNANDQFNLIVDAIINHLETEYNKIIDATNNENKAKLKTFLINVVNNANATNKEQSIIINNEVARIESELKDMEDQIKNTSFFKLYRMRKKVNLNLDLETLKDMENIPINAEDVFINSGVGDILTKPDFKKLDHVKIKEDAKNKINFQELYIKLPSEK